MPELQCIECLEWYGESFFSPTALRKSTFLKYRYRRCKLCRLDARTRAKLGKIAADAKQTGCYLLSRVSGELAGITCRVRAAAVDADTKKPRIRIHIQGLQAKKP
jgi:hypothetical protein